MTRYLTICLITLTAMIAPPAHAQQDAGLELVLSQQGTSTQALLVDSQVEISVDGLVARVRLFQNFENISGDWAEGIYRFPMPANAAVDEMRLRIGERLLEGEIQQKEQARETYTEALDSGIQATLVEQEDGDTFSARVANIAPGEWVQVEISYLQEVHFDNDHFSLRFPMTFTPGPGAPALLAPAGAVSSPDSDLPESHNSFSLQINLNAGLPLNAVQSLYHNVEVNPVGDQYQIEFTELVEPGNRDFVLDWYPEMGDEPIMGLLSEEFEGESYFLMMMVPPKAKSVGDTSRELVLIIDTSGSMEGDSLAQAKEALMYALDELQDTDRFNLIQFNSVTTAFAPNPLPATMQNLDLAREWVVELIAGGGTMMRPALEEALVGQPPSGLLKQVVFVTDGSVGDEQQLFDQIRLELGDARLFTVGIGAAPNSYFMRKAAEAGRGTFSYIGKTSEVGEKMARLFDKLRQPALTDICVDWPDKATSFPANVPDLYAGEPISVSTKMSFPDGNLSVCGFDGSRNWEKTLVLEGATPASGVATLWARRKIEALKDEAWRNLDAELVRQEIIDLALKHHLISDYTSLVAVDKTPVRSKDAMLRRQLVSNAPPRSADSVAMPSTALGLGFDLLLGAFGLFLLAAGRYRLRS